MYKIILAGETSIIIYFGHKINDSLPEKIRNFANHIKNEFGDVIINLTPSYTSLHVSYNLNLIDHQTFCSQVEHCLEYHQYDSEKIVSKLVNIPVYYGFEVGLDLERLLAEKNLDLNAFIHAHSSCEYLVYAIGFSPVFAFLGEVNENIQMPRLATPRIKIPAGSVGIAGNQTAIYPSDSSGGWNIVGRTLLDLSLNIPENIDKFSVGDRVKFHPITRDEFVINGGEL